MVAVRPAKHSVWRLFVHRTIDGLGPGRAWGGSSFVLDVDLSFMLIRVSSIIIASALVCRFSTVNFCRDGREDKTKTAHAVYVWCEF